MQPPVLQAQVRLEFVPERDHEVLRRRDDAAQEVDLVLPLRALLNDEWPDVRVVAAEALAHLGEQEAAAAAIAAVIKASNLREALAAQNALDFMRLAGHVTLAQAQDMVRGLKFSEPADRIPAYLLGLP